MAQNELQTTKDIIDIYRGIIQSILQLSQNEAERLLTEMQNKKLILTYGSILGDGTRAPETYVIKDEKLLDYIKKELNKTNEGKTLYDEGYFPTLCVKNHSGFPTYIINPDDKDRFEDILTKYYIINNEIVSEIPTNTFEEFTQGEQVTILKDLTEDQYLYIAERTKKNPESYSFSAQRNIDGTYCVSVLSRNMLTRKNEQASFFAGLAVAKSIDKGSQLAKSLNYDKDLLNEILTYNDEKTPMYISQARNAGIYMKVAVNPETNERVCTIYQGNTSQPVATIKTSRDALADSVFAEDVLRYFNKMTEPVKIYDKDINTLGEDIKTETDPGKKQELTNMQNYLANLKIKGIPLNTALSSHAMTGDDKDFAAGNMLRPMLSEKEEFNIELTQKYSKYVENKAIRNVVLGINEANKAKLTLVMQSLGLSPEIQTEVMKQFTNSLTKNDDYLASIQSKQVLTPELIKKQQDIYKSDFVYSLKYKAGIEKEDMSRIFNALGDDLKTADQKMLDKSLIMVNTDAPAMILQKTPEGFDELISRVEVEQQTGVKFSASEIKEQQTAVFGQFLQAAQQNVTSVIQNPAIIINMENGNDIESAITQNYTKEQKDDYYMLNHAAVKVDDTIILGQEAMTQAQMKGQISEFVQNVPSLKTEVRNNNINEQIDENLSKLNDGTIVPEGGNLGNAALDPSKMTNDDRDEPMLELD